MGTKHVQNNRCVMCNQESSSSIQCEGCAETFCCHHLTDHRLQLQLKLDEVENNCHLLQNKLTEQKTELEKHPLTLEIEKWERDSISKIEKAADKARQELSEFITNHTTQIETTLMKLTDQIQKKCQEHNFVEIDLNHWKKELDRLSTKLDLILNISLREDNSSLVKNISINIPSFDDIIRKSTWDENGNTVAGGNGSGDDLNQFSKSWSFCIDDNQTIYIADSENHRIVEWKYDVRQGRVVAGGNGRGNGKNQLNDPRDVLIDKQTDSIIISDQNNLRVVRWPRQKGTPGQIIISDIHCARLAMDNEGYLYVSDYDKHEVRRWKIGDPRGTLVAGGNGRGNELNQLNGPTCISIDDEFSLYVLDTNNQRIMKWMKNAKTGIVVVDSSPQLSISYGMTVDQNSTVYLSDYNNHRVMCWQKGTTQDGILLVQSDTATNANQPKNPTALKFDQYGNLHVLDQGNYRIQRFKINI